MRALGSVSVATEIHRCEPALDLERGRPKTAYAEGPHPTGKGAGVSNFRLVPTTRAEKRSPPLEIQLWGFDKIGAPAHYRLRDRKGGRHRSCRRTSTIQLAHNALAPLAIDQQPGGCGRSLCGGAQSSLQSGAKHSR